jgi:hypothetical protein
MRNSQQCRVVLWFIPEEQVGLSRWIINPLEVKGIVVKWQIGRTGIIELRLARG